jgi:hypothetical protein
MLSDVEDVARAAEGYARNGRLVGRMGSQGESG